MEILFLEDLEIMTIIGCLPIERTEPQLLLITVRLTADLSRCAKTDNLSHGIDYTQLATHLQTWADTRKAHLLEALAQYLCDLILQHYPCQAVSITIKKPGALANGMAGVQFTRTR